jgi:hypothetical protein
MSKTFSVYHQCYKNKKATEFAISQFKKYNPDVPYYLISDNGDNFLDLAEKYNCHYVHDEVNTGMNYLSPNHAKVLYGRLVDCFNVFGTDYVLLMEDDVLCRGKIIIEVDFNLAMSYVPGNKIYLYNKIVEKYNSNPNVDWYGATGGSILNKNIFTFQENNKKVNKFIEEDYDPIMGSMDQFITTLYLLCGYDCSVNNLLGETHRTPNWRESNFPLIHCFKEMY